MSRILSRTLRGHAAIRAALDWFGPFADSDNHPLPAFLADLRARGSRRLFEAPNWEGRQDSHPLGDARFRPKIGDPDIDGDEGTFGWGNQRISLDGGAIKRTDRSVLYLADRWGDSAMFGSHPEAPFDEAWKDKGEWEVPR